MTSHVSVLTVLYVLHTGLLWDITRVTEQCVSPDELVVIKATYPSHLWRMRITLFLDPSFQVKGLPDLDAFLTRVDELNLPLEQRQSVIHCFGCDEEGNSCRQCGQEIRCGIDAETRQIIHFEPLSSSTCGRSR